MPAIVMTCTAPAELFTAATWDELPEDVRRILNAQGRLPCGGGGVVKGWCVQCHWCGWEEA